MTLRSLPPQTTLWLLAALCLALQTGCPADAHPIEENTDTNANNDVDMGDNNGVDMNNDNATTNGNTNVNPGTIALSSIAPTMGSVEGGTSVTLVGEGFADGMTVNFGVNAASSVMVQGPTSAIAVTPSVPMAGAVDVTVSLNGNSDTLNGAFEYTGVMMEDQVFCRLQAQSPVTGTTNMPTDQLYVAIFATGVTPGDGQGAGVEAQLGVGTDAGDYENFDYAPMAYNVDLDGLTPGDKSNDEYGASLLLEMAGNYRYIARVKVPTISQDWVYCDLDGSDNGVQDAQLGELTIGAPPMLSIDYCKILTADAGTVETGQQASAIEAEIFAENFTPGDGAAMGVVAELGLGATATDYENFNFIPMTYARDGDGPNAGDKANDVYSARASLSMAGDFLYVVRMRPAADANGWVYCDTDGFTAGNMDFDSANLGTIKAEDPPQPKLSFCQLDTTQLSLDLGETSMGIEAKIYGNMITTGAGQGAGVEAELLWGDPNTAPMSWTNTITASYDRDGDGLMAGDQANDIYSATIRVAVNEIPGDYGFVYRFRKDGGAWLYCDADGADDSGTTFDATQAGSLEIVDPAQPVYPDYCNTQFPLVLDRAQSNQDYTFYGRIQHAGITDMGDDQPEIKADLLIGPIGVDPTTNAGQFTAYPATFNTTSLVVGTDVDEYAATFTPTTAGEYAAYFRFSVDGSNYSYCDTDGTMGQTGFEANKGAAIVVDNPEVIDFCVFNSTGVMASLAMAAPDVYLEVFEGGITDMGQVFGDLEAEVGLGPEGANPIVAPADFAWNSLSMSVVNPNAGNNWDYFGPAFPMMTQPAAGDYALIGRIRRTGTSTWTYCDTDRADANTFSFKKYGTITVTQ